MDAPRRTLTLACGALLWALLTAGSCATTPPPAKAKAKPPEPPPAAAPAPAPESEAAPAATPPAEPEPPAKDKDIEVVIDPGGDKAHSVSLLEAGRAERERRANSGPPVAVITDKNLKEYAAKGQLTVADVRKNKPQPAAAAPEGTGTAHGEQYWRSRGREIRTRWKDTAEEVKKLEAAAAGLRRSFYAEDDPYVRDGKVKPEWDRVLDRLQEAREDVVAVKKELADFEEQGRREGALPGWLREGVELVPEAEKKMDLKEHEPIEPPEYVPSEPPPTR